MMRNLESSKGLIVGEAVMMGLAPVVGRNAAHDIVYDACKTCIEDGESTLFEELMKRPEVTEKMDEGRIKALCDPRNYLGAAQQMVDDVLASTKLGKRSANGGAKLNGANGIHHLNGSNGIIGANGH